MEGQSCILAAQALNRSQRHLDRAGLARTVDHGQNLSTRLSYTQLSPSHLTGGFGAIFKRGLNGRVDMRAELFAG